MERPVRTLLVPCDGSPESLGMLRIACSVALLTESRVIALYVVIVQRSLPIQGLPDWMDDGGHAALRRAVGETKWSGVDVVPKLTHGRDVASAIVRQARMLEADGIFMAAGRPHRWLWNLIFKPTCSTVERLAPCPVIVGRAPLAEMMDGHSAIAEAERMIGRRVSWA